MAARLSTHVLNTAHGCPAQGMKIQLWALRASRRTLLKEVRTNIDGRTDEPLLTGNQLKRGQYELLFFVGDYFTTKTPRTSRIRFLDRVPVRFGIENNNAPYHVPLLVSPWAYSTYRGS